MSVTPKERQRISELMDAASANKVTVEATVRAIHQELPHITADELIEVCDVRAEECCLDAAVLKAEAKASQFIGNTLRENGYANLKVAFKALTLRSEQGDRGAAELLEQLNQAYILVGDWIRVR